MIVSDFLKGTARGYGIDEEEPFSCSHVLFSHCPDCVFFEVRHTAPDKREARSSPVFLLSGCVQHIEQRDFVVNNALLSV